MTNEDKVKQLISLLRASEQMDYVGEDVSQMAHALQAAYLAEQHGADDETVAAALLHDIGHICATEKVERMGRFGIVDHEGIGERYLTQLGFPPKVTSIVRGHVEAKRYLTWKNPSYLQGLSEASYNTLMHQGGPMTDTEAQAFEADPLYKTKLLMRTWDEKAKEPMANVPGPDHYSALLLRVLDRAQQATAEAAPAKV